MMTTVTSEQLGAVKTTLQRQEERAGYSRPAPGQPEVRHLQKAGLSGSEGGSHIKMHRTEPQKGRALLYMTPQQT